MERVCLVLSYHRGTEEDTPEVVIQFLVYKRTSISDV